MERQPDADAACKIPDDFEADSTDRQACWDGLPAAAKSYITRLRAALSSKGAAASNQASRADELASRCLVYEQRITELDSVANCAWGHRFMDAHSFKVAVLKRAHACELRRLRREWDDRRFRPGGASSNACSLHRLDSVLLEKIVSRLEGDSLLHQQPNAYADTAAVRKRQGDKGWHARRVLARVCRLFEALAYALPYEAFFRLLEGEIAPNAPLGFALRDIERAALATRLGELVLYLEHRNPECREVCAAACALQQCAALHKLTLVLSPAVAGQFCLTQALLAALPSCPRLSQLMITAGKGRVRISKASVSALLDVLPCMPALECLGLEHMAFPADSCEKQSIPTVLSECKSLRRFHAFNMQCPCSWQAIAGLRLSDVSVEAWSQQEGALPTSLELSTSLNSLAVVDVHNPPEHERQLARALPATESLQERGLGLLQATMGGHEAFAEALPQVKALRCLTLMNVSETQVLERYAAALPRCGQLRRLQLAFCSVHNNASWATTLAAAIAACPALISVLLNKVTSLSGAPLNLGPFWQVLPDCKLLRAVSVTSTKLRSMDVCVLCPVLERCPALKLLSLTDCGLEQDGISMLKWAVENHGIDFRVE